MKTLLNIVTVSICIAIVVSVVTGFTLGDWQCWAVTCCLVIIYKAVQGEH